MGRIDLSRIGTTKAPSMTGLWDPFTTRTATCQVETQEVCAARLNTLDQGVPKSVPTVDKELGHRRVADDAC